MKKLQDLPSHSLALPGEDNDKKIITHYSVMKDRSISLKPKFNPNKSNLDESYNQNSRIFSHFQKRMGEMSKPTL